MNLYKYIAQTWKKSEESSITKTMRSRLSEWRKQPSILRIDKPSRLNRARSLGYKAKTGFVLVRVRVRRGGLHKTRPKAGRRQRRMGVTSFVPANSIRLIAEKRAARRFPNLLLLNSYWVWEDGRYKWFEVILVDQRNISTDKLSKKA